MTLPGSRHIIVAAWIMILALFLTLNLPLSTFAETTSLEVGQAAPHFTLPDLEGQDFSLESLANKHDVVVLLFWGVWCPFCREIMVRLRSLHTELNPVGLEVLSVSMRESPHKVRLFIDKLQPGFRVLVDEWAEIQDSYAIRDVPRIVILDRSLTVLATRITTSVEIMERMIRETMRTDLSAPSPGNP